MTTQYRGGHRATKTAAADVRTPQQPVSPICIFRTFHRLMDSLAGLCLPYSAFQPARRLIHSIFCLPSLPSAYGFSRRLMPSLPPSSPLIGLCIPYSAFRAFHQLMDSLAGLRLPSRLPTHSPAYAFHIPSSGPFIGSRFPVHGPYPEACEFSHGDPAAWIWTCRRSRSGYKLQYIL